MGNPPYATREALRAALDVAESPRADGQIDRLLDAASRSVEALTHRIWYPTTATRYWDWPDRQHGTSYRLWLDDSELISVSAISSGGETISSGDYFLEPNRFGPPYNRLELDRDADARFGGGNTPQRDITITGVFGACNDTAVAGVLNGAINSSVTTVALNTGEAVGVGDLLILGTEYMWVTGRSLVDTTVNLGASLTASKADVTLTVADGTLFAVGELLRVDAERMQVVDTGATSVYVRRAVDGTTLAAHSNAADVYASRSFTVRRGQLGTTAASHLDNAAVSKHAYPGLISTLALDEALWKLQSEQSGMARTIGEGENARQVTASSIRDLRNQVRETHGRTMRKRAI
jgi:hypothetical protein